MPLPVSPLSTGYTPEPDPPVADDTYAVLIGVDDYSDFDPSGDADLLGAVNDVKAWHRFLTCYLMVPEENIRVLKASSLRNDAPEAPWMDGKPKNVSNTANKQEIIDAVKWLVEKLEHGCTGVMTWSGHGMYVDDLRGAAGAEEGSTLALCPQDTRRTPNGELDVDSILTFVQLSEYLPSAKRSTVNADEKPHYDNLTVFLDTCYTNSGLGRSLISADTEGLDSKLHRRGGPTIFGRLLLATEAFDQAHEILNAGYWNGAFTWAMVGLMDQWTRKSQTNGKHNINYLNVSHNDITFTVRNALNLLAVNQINRYTGLPMVLKKKARKRGARLAEIGDVPLFHRGRVLPPGSLSFGTSTQPDVSRPGEELPVGTAGFYKIRVTVTTSTTTELGADASAMAEPMVLREVAEPVPQDVTTTETAVNITQDSTDSTKEDWSFINLSKFGSSWPTSFDLVWDTGTAPTPSGSIFQDPISVTWNTSSSSVTSSGTWYKATLNYKIGETTTSGIETWIGFWLDTVGNKLTMEWWVKNYSSLTGTMSLPIDNSTTSYTFTKQSGGPDPSGWTNKSSYNTGELSVVT